MQHSYCSLCVSQAAQQGNAPEEGKKEDSDKEQGEEEGNEGKRSKRAVYDDMQEVTEPSRLQERDMQSYNQKQPGGEEKETDEWNGRPVVPRQGNSDVRLQDPGNQGENAQLTQEQYEHREPDNQRRETIDKDEDHDEQESDLSRKNINKQMAEMQESYNEKRKDEQRQEQEMQILPQERNSDARGRSVYRNVAPIPAVQRQDTAEEQADGKLFCQEEPSSFYVVIEKKSQKLQI